MAASGDEVRAFTVRLPVAEYEGLRHLAFFNQTTMGDLLLRAVRGLLAEAKDQQDIDALIDRTRTRFRETLDRIGDDGDDGSE